MNAALDSFQADADRCGYLLIRESLHIPQYHHEPVFLRQPVRVQVQEVFVFFPDEQHVRVQRLQIAVDVAPVERNLRLVLGADKDNVLALETLAMIEAEQKKWPAALEDLDKLIALRPGVPRFLKTAGSCALMEGDVQGARDRFDRATVQAPAARFSNT